MLTLQKADIATIVSLSTASQSLNELLSKEWLLTNGRGGYSSSTVVGCNTSSYHGLLVGSLRPPVSRVMALANCQEMLIFPREARPVGRAGRHGASQVRHLSTFEFDNKFAPRGYSAIKNFWRDTGVHFGYEFAECRVTKSVYLTRGVDMVILEYDFTEVSRIGEFMIRPFVGLRDFHGLLKSDAVLNARIRDDGIAVHSPAPGCTLSLNCPAAAFEKNEQWWFKFVYRVNKERGQEFTEDLWTPGFFKTKIDSPCRIVFWANLIAGLSPVKSADIDCDLLRSDLNDHHHRVISAAGEHGDRDAAILHLAADQFIIKRDGRDGAGTTIVAGYPWFGQWGRDAFIALPGLLLETRRFDEARSVLKTIAASTDEGMIPNCLDDKTETAHFNSVDASLWFVNGAFQYLDATGDLQTFTQDLLPIIRWIIDSYQKGTRFDIHADTDGLISAGDVDTQLTWMDAKCGEVAFTPRYGKAVEVNALWHNALQLMARFYADGNADDAGRYRAMAEQAAESFRRLFWNDRLRCLNDCILPGGSADSSLRPNQIFAASLRFSPLTFDQQKAVVSAVHSELLTPMGLRSLNPHDKRYKAVYAGSPRQRDEAYHQGTVWAFLMGPFIEAYLKVNKYSKKSRKAAAEFIQPLMQHLTEDACLGSISEIFDGEPPHRARGCIAQAWSVAELLRAHRLIKS
ncbi:MAG: glycogen debranching enzyme family protein [Sedimentisphaerales bacterium]|nr:glycogen debranching enzyme family protein [Sedimentisphaerales bacterium]